MHLQHALPLGIPVGDLFVAMESWEEAEKIAASMEVILEIEAEASRNISSKEGLLELLQLLADSQVGGILFRKGVPMQSSIPMEGVQIGGTPDGWMNEYEWLRLW
jgi:hypothetical protein